MSSDIARSPEEILLEFLDSIGLTGDEELSKTHIRVTEFLESFAPDDIEPALSLVPTKSSDPIIVDELVFHSLCAHHLLPFFGKATVAILPNETIAGLGGIPRALRHFAQQPQIQERLAAQMASFLMDKLRPEAVVIAIKATHLCMEMRGIRASGEVTTIASRGAPEGVARLELLMASAKDVNYVN
jgi:GTP cyclohydrolase IA